MLNLETGHHEPYEQVLKSKYPAKLHAKRVAEWIVKNGGENGVLYLEGQKTRMNEVLHFNLVRKTQANVDRRIVIKKYHSGGIII